MDSEKQIYFIGVRKKPEVLQVIRTVFSDRLASEKSEGDATFLKISSSGSPGGSGAAPPNFYYLGVTPEALLGAPRLETIKELLAGHSAGSTATLAALPQFQHARAQFPERVNAISYFDFQKLDWQAAKDRWIEEVKKSPDTKDGKTPGTAAKATEWLTHADPRVIPRHLRVSSSASWKDAQGLHFDWWLE